MYKTYKFGLLIVSLLQFCILPVYSIKAYPFPILESQPDGTTITVRLQGDEHQHFHSTEDGYVLKRNGKGYFTYATKNANGEIVESTILARDIKKRKAKDKQFLEKSAIRTTDIQVRSASSLPSRASLAPSASLATQAYPRTGSPKALVILVEFADNSFSVASPNTAFTNLLNEVGYSANGGTGSACDYFKASTFGKFSPQFDVVGPYKLPQAIDYYGTNDVSGWDVNPRQMVIDACTLASADGLNFSQYDADLNGIVDNVFIYYAGYNEAEGADSTTIWPHRWSLANTLTKFNGKSIYGYACTSELRGKVDVNMCGIGTFCHEFGHVLGLPDYYHTTVKKNALKSWSIMDEGAYNNLGRTPPLYSVWDRFFLGYFTPEQKSATENLKLLPLYQGSSIPATTNNQSFLFSTTNHNLNGAAPNPAEFFMVEYRKKTGWDAYLPAEGMLIWHIDFLQSAWTANSPNNYGGTTQTPTDHMRVYIQPLSGSTTTPGTAFTTGSFTPTSWAGTNINRAITDIQKTADSITFKLMKTSFSKTPDSNLSFTGTLLQASPVQTIALQGEYLNGNLVLGFTNNLHYELKLTSASTWGKSLSIVPTVGNVMDTIVIRYLPQLAGLHEDTLHYIVNLDTLASTLLTGTAIDPNAPIIRVGVIRNLLQFPPVKVSSTEIKQIRINGISLSADLNISIEGADASQFSISTSTATMAEANASGGIILEINYSPTVTGTHNATLLFSGGGLAVDREVQLIGTTL